MSIDSSVNDFLNGGGGKTASFDNPGDKIKGTVVHAEQRQQIDYVTKEPKFWDEGDPMMQLVVTLQTDERDPADPNDDGQRNIYCKGSKKTGSMTSASALIDALRKAGAQLEVGGTLVVAYVGDGVPSKPGLNAPKQYAMAYKAPALDLGADFTDVGAPAPAPAPQPAPTPAVSEEDLFAEL